MTEEAGLRAVSDVRRDHVEDFKLWLAARPRGAGRTITAETHRQRMRTVRQFFERIIEWDWPDAPQPRDRLGHPEETRAAPEVPRRPDAARLMAAARNSTDPRDRLVMELLARTGMRAGELAGLEADAVVLIGSAHGLRIPLGKLRNDRYVPLHPELVQLLAAWTAAASPASSAASLAQPASPASTRTGCGTPWPPRRSTAVCASRPSPRCSATRKWK
jgi:site-specific recombinase XerD